MFAATVLQTWNTALNVLAVAIPVIGGIYFGPKYLKMRDARAQLEEKDRTISTHVQTIQALSESNEVRDERIDALEVEVQACRSEIGEARQEAQLWKGRYEAQHEFTAEPALVAVRAAIHEMKDAMKVAVEAQGELLAEEMRQTRLVLDALASRA